MLKFNNNNIFTGYLKQLLKAFNLPKYRVYTCENKRYHDWAVAERLKLQDQQIKEELWPPLEKDILETIEPIDDKIPDNLRYALYIKDGNIQKYINKEWINTSLQYFPNKAEQNQTKNLNINGTIYDSYTHEYLGDFLRFIRDYYDINLMPLYNCFSNTLCQNLKLHLSTANEYKATFDTTDLNYKIYMLPVKLFKKYTIAIESSTPIELCCGFYGAYQDERDKLKYISDFTYMKVNSSKFNTPFLYDKLSSDFLDSTAINFMELAQNEPDLKLFIKLPANNTSTITVLEGNYLGYNNSLYVKDTNRWIYKSNRFVTNYAKTNEVDNTIVNLPSVDEREFNPITELQLLKLNTGSSYPFADRLIEYLSGNAITSEDQISDNFKRIQTIMAQWDVHFPIWGAWDPAMRNIVYDYMTSDNIENIKLNPIVKHDILGYIDKDAEKYFIGKISSSNKYPTSISNVYIYPDLYKTYQKEKLKGVDK